MQTKEIISLERLTLLCISFLLILYLSLKYQAYIIYFTDRYNQYIIIFAFINLLLYKYVVKKQLMETMVQDSNGKIARNIEPTHSILIVGDKGTKKTNNVVQLAQVCEAIKIDKMQSIMVKIVVLLSKHINFASFNQYIDDNFNHDHVYTDEDYIEFAKDFFGKEYPFFLKNQIRLEAYKHLTINEALAEYVELYYYLNFRKSHILANIGIESVNTGLMSIPLKESLDQLYLENDLAHEKHLVKIEDEKGFLDNARVYARMDKKSVEQNDDGKDANEMLRRHGEKSTNTNLVVSQNDKEVTANRRRLYNRILEFLTPKEIYIYSLEIFISTLIFNKVHLMETKKYSKKMKKMNKCIKKYNKKEKAKYLDKANKLYEKYSDYLYKQNNYKKINNLIVRFQMLLQRDEYLVQYSFIHTSADRIGKTGESETTIASSMPIIFFFHVKNSYEKYDQHGYYYLYNLRNKAATIPLAKRERFSHKIMRREAFEAMDYRATNKALQAIDSQIARSNDEDYEDPSEF